MSHDDFEFEPQPGLPAPLPAGERLLWQGRPCWRLLARRAYHVRKVAAYFGALAALRLGFGVSAHESAWGIGLGTGWILVLGACAVAILAGLACLSARQAVFSITSRRVLLRHGVAVPLTLNLPFSQIAAADLRRYGENDGDILLRAFDETRIGYLINWPYVRPGHFAHPQPSLRALRGAPAAAQILGTALEAYLERAPAAPAERAPASTLTASAA